MDYMSQKPWPISQTIISWLFVILFTILVGDWNFIGECFEQRQNEIANAILPGSPEYDQIVSETVALVQSVHQKAKDGTLTVQEGVIAQIQVSRNCSKIDRKWGIYTKTICDLACQFYVDSWQSSGSMPKYYIEEFEKNPSFKRSMLESEFRDKWLVAQLEARQLFPESRSISGKDIGSFVMWLLKWYWLMTIPSLIIFLLNRRYKGESVREELLLQPVRLFLACCFGPIGLVVISETVARANRYIKLADEVRRQTGQWRLSKDEEQAVLRQLEEPLLRFDQAMEIVIDGGERLRRPATVCALAWFIGFFQAPISQQVSQVRAFCQSSVLSDEQQDVFVLDASRDETLYSVELMLAILPISVDWPVFFNVEKVESFAPYYPGTVFWEHVLARGPPKVAKGQMSLFKLCPWLQKAERVEL